MIGLLVGLAGGLGAATRFVVDAAIRHLVPGPFPVATVVINTTGSLVLGVLTGAAAGGGGHGWWLAVAGVGYCGGYTTFGTAMIETLRLQQRGRLLLAVANHLGTAALCLVAAAAGLLLAGARW